MTRFRFSPRIISPIALVIGCFATTGDAFAQVTGAFEAGSGTTRLGSGSQTGVVNLAPGLQFESRLVRVSARADYGQLPERGWQTSGEVVAALRVPMSAGIRAELATTGAWSRLSWGRAAAGALTEVGLEAAGPTRGLALRAGLGRAFPYGPSEGFSRVEARTWSRLAGLDLGFSLRRTGLVSPGSSSSSRGDSPLPGADTMKVGGGEISSARRIQDHYTDFNATVGWARNAVELEAGLGRRFGKPVNEYTSWRIQAVYWLAERLALVASAGRFPNDVISGLPSGSFALLSMRISWNDRPVPSRIALPGRIARSSTGFNAQRNSTGQVALRVWAPSAQRVEVMGSFNDWQPVELEGGIEGWWRAELALAPGLYEINVRFDGGPWQVPQGLTAVDDGFGGQVGVFTIPVEE